jgi:tetratricopeptide (TPR) repeat protein
MAVAAGTTSTIIQSRRAERRFDDVRQLANTLIFKVHDAVAPLAGSTPVRQMIINEGLAYLERLTAESAGDRQLQLEIAGAYDKIGTVQGLPSTANLGDRAGAVSSFQKAEAILRPPAIASDASAAVIRAYVAATNHLTETLVQGVVPPAEAIAPARRGIEVGEAFIRREPRSDEGRMAVASAYFAASRAADEASKLEYLQRAREMYRELLAGRPDDPARQRSLAIVEKYLGAYYEIRHDYATALTHHQAALQLDEQRAHRSSEDRVVQFDLAIDLSNIAYGSWQTGHLNEAVSLYERSLELRKQLAASDPKDVLARNKVAFMEAQLGRVRRDQGLPEKAIAHFRAALQLYETLDMSTLDTKYNVAGASLELGRLEPNRVEGCRLVARAFQLFLSMPESQRNLSGDDEWFPKAVHDAAACGVTQARQWLQNPAAHSIK